MIVKNNKNFNLASPKAPKGNNNKNTLYLNYI